MKNITRVDALNYAIAAVTNSTEVLTNPTEIVEVLTKIRDQIAKPRNTSDEAKAKAAAKRKEKAASARAEVVAKVAPILRKHLTADITAKALYEMAKDELPADFSAAKVQNILLREMAAELIKTETKGKANTYRLMA